MRFCVVAARDDRTYQTSLRLTESERARLQKAADDLGMPLSIYVRMILKTHLDKQDTTKYTV